MLDWYFGQKVILVININIVIFVIITDLRSLIPLISV